MGGVAGVVLAAGGSKRFGSPKQVAVLEARPLLEHVITELVQSALGRIVVVLGSNAGRVLAETDLEPAEVVLCRDWAQGMSASLRAGIGAARTRRRRSSSSGSTGAVGRERRPRPRRSTAGGRILRATYDGRPGTRR